MTIETFKIVVMSRIDNHKADEAEKMEAVRVQAEAAARAKMEAEAKAKEEAEAKAKIAADAAAIDAELAAKPVYAAEQAQIDHNKALQDDVEARRRAAQLSDQEKALAGKYPPAKQPDPSNGFDHWWATEGSGMPPLPNEDAEEHVRRISRIAWESGAFETAERMKVAA